MTATVSGADYDSRSYETILGLSFRFSDKILEPIFKKMSAEDKKYFEQNRNHEIFTSDGDDHDEPVGTMNFYTAGLTPDAIKRIVEAIIYYAKEFNLKLGQIRGPEKSGMYKSQVIRIPIVKNYNVEKTKEHAPEINWSNDNAYLIFNRVLRLYDFDVGEHYSIAAIDLLQRVETVLKRAEQDDEYLYHHARPSSVDKQPDKATMIMTGLNPDDIVHRLIQLKKLCEYAIDKGHPNINIT